MRARDAERWQQVFLLVDFLSSFCDQTPWSFFIAEVNNTLGYRFCGPCGHLASLSQLGGPYTLYFVTTHRGHVQNNEFSDRLWFDSARFSLVICSWKTDNSILTSLTFTIVFFTNGDTFSLCVANCMYPFLFYLPRMLSDNPLRIIEPEAFRVVDNDLKM